MDAGPDGDSRPSPSPVAGLDSVGRSSQGCDAVAAAAQMREYAPLGAVRTVATPPLAGASVYNLDGVEVALQVESPTMLATPEGEGGWRCLADPPVGGPLTAAAGTGGQLVTVSADRSAMYDAATDTWRLLPSPPGVSGQPLSGAWTGSAFAFVWASGGPDTGSAVASFSPDTGRWARRDDAPFAVNRAYNTSLVAVGPDVVLFGTWLDGSNRPASPTAQSALYSAQDETWIGLPDSPLSPQAAGAVAVGSRVVAVDYDGSTASLDVDTRAWTDTSSTPLQPTECPPQVGATELHVVVVACSQMAVFHNVTRTWTAMPLRIDPPLIMSLAGTTHDRFSVWAEPTTDTATGAWLLTVDPAAPLSAPRGSRDVLFQVLGSERIPTTTVKGVVVTDQAGLDSGWQQAGATTPVAQLPDGQAAIVIPVVADACWVDEPALRVAVRGTVAIVVIGPAAQDGRSCEPSEGFETTLLAIAIADHLAAELSGAEVARPEPTSR